MASETTNYGFTLPDKSDRINITPINNNFSSIDTILKTQEDAAIPHINTEPATANEINAFFSGIKTGSFAADVLGTASVGVLRAYPLSATDSMQVIETADGYHYTRHYTSGVWSEWI